jgi:hypothetical protein
MSHLNEEQLILFYYGEEGDTLTAEQHLEECGECRALFGSLQRVLNVVDSLPLPERGAEYGQQVWRRIERRLSAGVGSRIKTPGIKTWLRPGPWRWAVASVAGAALIVAAFLAGRFLPQARQPAQMAAVDSQAGERILMVAVGDYLERSQMVLIELANANPKGSLDISAEQERAGDLVSETRLYRQTAAHTGDTAVSSVLEELERVLLDITHAPSQISPQDLEKMRRRLETEGILFKIRVLGSNVRNQEEPAATAAGQKL